MEHTHLMKTGNFDEFCFKKDGTYISNGSDPGAQAHGTHAICHAEFSMFGRVKSGTINASQLFFQGSHVFFPFSISGNMPATEKNHYILPLAVKISDTSAVKICSIRRSQFQRQMWGQAQNHQKKQIQWTLWDHVIPSAFYSFHLISFTQSSRGPSHHKSGSLNNKYEYNPTSQSTGENHLPMYEPLPSLRQRHSQNDPLIFPSLSSDHFLLSLINCAFIALLSFARGTQSIRLQKRDTPKTTPKPFQGHGRRCWPRPPWPLQRSAARPRRNGLSEPHIAAPSGLGAEDARRTAGQLQLPSRNKAYSHGMFLQAVGQNSEYRS